MRRKSERQGLLWACGVGAVLGCDAQAEPSYQGEPLATLEGRVESLSDIQVADVGLLWLTSSAQDECSGPHFHCGASMSGPAYPAPSECTDGCGPEPSCSDPVAHEAFARCVHNCDEGFQVGSNLSWSMCSTGAVATSFPVEGDFPAQFTVDVLEPPPDHALLTDDGGSQAAMAYFIALTPGVAPVSVATTAGGPPSWLRGSSDSHVLAYLPQAVPSESSWAMFLGEPLPEGFHLMRVVPGVRCGLPAGAGRESMDPQVDEGAGAALTVEGEEGVAAANVVGAGGGPSDLLEEEPAPTESSFPAHTEQDLTGVELVCGNGVCEEGENCVHCSDCECADGEALGESTGITNLDRDDYRCWASGASLKTAAEGEGSQIQLMVGPLESLRWPDFR